MNDKIFYIGQEVTPIGDTWTNLEGELEPGPKLGEVLTVVAYAHYIDHKWYIDLAEYPAWHYREDCFAPVMTTAELVENLESIEEPVVL